MNKLTDFEKRVNTVEWRTIHAEVSNYVQEQETAQELSNKIFWALIREGRIKP